jgi:superfamily II DNA or RNA helicase
MERDERRQIHAIAKEVAAWVDEARAVISQRTKIEAAGDAAVSRLRQVAADVRPEGQDGWRVIPFRASDGRYLTDIARQKLLPALSGADQRALRELTEDADTAVRDVRAILGARRFFSGRQKRDAGTSAVSFLAAYREQALASGTPELLRRLSAHKDGVPREVPPAEAIADWVGLTSRMAGPGSTQALLPAAVAGELPRAIAVIQRVLAEETRLQADAVKAGHSVRRHEASQLLAEMPVERLKDATRDRIRISPLADAGLTTVQSVLNYGPGLEYLQGIGATTATRIRGAAQTLWQTTLDELPVRIDIKNRSAQTTELLRRLGAWDVLRRAKGATSDLALAEALTPLALALDQKVSHLAVMSATRSPTEFGEAVEAVTRRARQLAAALSPERPDDPWDDFLRRPADYFALLAELGFNTEDEQKTHGDLPDEIVEAARQLELDTQYLSASLRGYQSFGARFALVQRKVIIGDEMGLGKTVEALAVLAHLRAKGCHHTLVICPAAVVTNWIREIGSKSTLRPYRLHGADREQAARGWVRNGGVAVTTFETLGWLEIEFPTWPELGCVVVDEAHYIKNPAAQRSRRTTRILRSCPRAVLLTGTPLENRIDEFRNLVGYLRPDLVVEVDELAPRRFRRQVAPAYLRRNQEDVLTELPELVEVDEWLPLSTEDAQAYRQAVAAGNFMAMRQAAMSQGTSSEKVQRLVEIVEEAGANGRRVIVFSHFRAVLDQVARMLPGQIFGPLTGSVPAAARQLMVDEFTEAGAGAVLVSQIIAGGVGLNIQAASVVVICEPQLKPTTEWQAIARAHRMGQLESVQVHRLLSEEGVDLRVTEILARKRELFEDFARVSDTAASAPEAYDLTEAELAREVVAAERERLFATGASAAEDTSSQRPAPSTLRT